MIHNSRLLPQILKGLKCDMTTMCSEWWCSLKNRLGSNAPDAKMVMRRGEIVLVAKSCVKKIILWNAKLFHARCFNTFEFVGLVHLRLLLNVSSNSWRTLSKYFSFARMRDPQATFDGSARKHFLKSTQMVNLQPETSCISDCRLSGV